MVAKEFQIKLELTCREQAHNLAHGLDEQGMAIRRKAHHLVFVAIMRKSEVLRECLIENTERMRKIHAAMNRDFGLRCRAPGRAREIAETIDRDNRRLIKRPDMKCRG